MLNICYNFKNHDNLKCNIYNKNELKILIEIYLYYCEKSEPVNTINKNFYKFYFLGYWGLLKMQKTGLQMFKLFYTKSSIQ